MIQLGPTPPGAVPPVAPPAPAATVAVRAPRVVFVDLARSLAVVFMLYGHAIDALLAPGYQTGGWFAIWQFQRGLTAALFLLMAGFAFSIATSRRWSSHLTPSSVLLRRVRRFGFYVLLGYALHLPVGSLSALAAATDTQWRALLAVDVLQLVGVTFLTIQALVLLTRSRTLFALTAGILAVVVVVATPGIWRIDWTGRLPLWAASFLSPASGSLFPLFPWAGYVLAGTVLGETYLRWGAGQLAAYANGVLLGAGGLLLLGGRALRAYQVQLFGAEGYSYVPPEVAIRLGACLVIVGLLAHASRFIRRLPAVWSAVAQETLVIYFIHLCIVYGSIWNPGLVRIFGQTLTPGPMAAVVVVLVTSMVLLAWGWHRLKRQDPRGARLLGGAVAAALFLRLA